MKKLISALLAVACLSSVALTGCQPSSKGNATASSSGKPATLAFFWWGTQPRVDSTTKVIKMYEQEHPNITVTPEYQGFDGYFQKLSMMAAAGNMPDIIQFSVGAAACSQFIDKKLIEPLDSYVKNKQLDISDITSSALSTGKQNGKLYGVTLGSNALAMVLDPDAYQKAGLTIPTDGYKSWDDLEKDLVKLKAVTGAYGADDLLNTQTVFQYWCRQNGKDEFDAQKGIGFTESIYTGFYDLKKKWIQEGLIPTYDIASAVKTASDSEIAKHKSAVYYTWANSYPSLVSACGKNLVMVPMPGPNQKQGMWISASMDLSMSSSSKNKDESAKFISYFVNNIEANKVLNAERGMPAAGKVRSAMESGFSAAQKTEADYIDKVSKNSAAASPAAPSNSTAINSAMTTLEEEILYNKRTSAQAFQDLETQVKTLQANS